MTISNHMIEEAARDYGLFYRKDGRFESTRRIFEASDVVEMLRKVPGPAREDAINQMMNKAIIKNMADPAAKAAFKNAGIK